jgi:aryl-alcohol dehydrogenase
MTGREPSSPVRKIRAAVFRERGTPLTIEPVEIEGPLEHEVLVRLAAAGICHTDIGYADDWGTDQPVILGHEGAGTVVEAGKKVKGLAPGDHVVLSYGSCGECSPCRRGRPADCRNLMELNFGFSRLDGSSAYGPGVHGHFFCQSSFATYSLATERNSVKVPRNLPLRVLAPLGCGIQTGAGTVMNSLGVSAGATIAVFGTGSAGLAAVMAARIVGAAKIIGIDIVPARLKLARKLGATHLVNARLEDVSSAIRKITGKGIDYSVETTDDDEMFDLAMELLNPRGKAALLSGRSGPSSLPGGRKALSVIQGDADPQAFIPRLIELYKAGLFPFDRLEKFYRFAEINEAMEDSRKGRTIKPVLLFGSSRVSF